jgi:hypothetical protein
VAIWTIRLAPGASWTLPPAAAGSNRFLYFFAGEGLRISGQAVSGHALAVVDPDSPVRLDAADVAIEILLLQGRPIAEPVAQYGPFVMNTRAEVQQAFADYQRTQFGGWPWPSPDPVHGMEGRFARQADGRLDHP